MRLIDADELQNEYMRTHDGKRLLLIDTAPTVGDVVDEEAYRRLLKAAKKMHLWIFLHSGDEQSAYDECELTPELNSLLGYGGQYELKFISKEDK